MSASDVNTAMAAAQAALASGDYDTALDQAIAAQGYLAALPDKKRGEQLELRWDRAGIEAFIGRIEQRRQQSLAASVGVQRQKITRVAISG